MKLHSAYENFRDPWGLFLRMARSGDRAAYDVLIRTALTATLTPMDLLLQPAEHRRIRAARPSPTLPLVLVVGAPRSGTTLVSQILARYLPVTYFTNLSALFPRAPLTATRLIYRTPPRPASSHSYYGNTAGLAGLNDGFHVWNRWLGHDRYETPDALDAAAVADMRRFFAAWTETFTRPLLNKNNRNADCVALLGRALPTALFVVVRRDPRYVAQSLLIARERIQGHRAYKWGLHSTDPDDAAGPLGYVDSVCSQIVEIDRKLRAAQRSLTSDRVIEVQYERFCEDPAATIAQVSARISDVPLDTTAVRRQLTLVERSTNQPEVTPEELARIDHRLADSGLL